MPGVDEQPEYYDMLADTHGRADLPGIEILVAVDREDRLLGAVTFVGQMASYGSGGRAPQCAEACGVRLLAVDPAARRMGVGRKLTMACIRRAGAFGAERVILHTTRAMGLAWGMYEIMGFVRCPDLDFRQGDLPVFGFSLGLPGSRPSVFLP